MKETGRTQTEKEIAMLVGLFCSLLFLSRIFVHICICLKFCFVIVYCSMQFHIIHLRSCLDTRFNYFLVTLILNDGFLNVYFSHHFCFVKNN
jgi:hypothetical protein